MLNPVQRPELLEIPASDDLKSSKMKDASEETASFESALLAMGPAQLPVAQSQLQVQIQPDSSPLGAWEKTQQPRQEGAETRPATENLKTPVNLSKTPFNFLADGGGIGPQAKVQGKGETKGRNELPGRLPNPVQDLGPVAQPSIPDNVQVRALLSDAPLSKAVSTKTQLGAPVQGEGAQSAGLQDTSGTRSPLGESASPLSGSALMAPQNDILRGSNSIGNDFEFEADLGKFSTVAGQKPSPLFAQDFLKAKDETRSGFGVRAGASGTDALSEQSLFGLSGNSSQRPGSVSAEDSLGPQLKPVVSRAKSLAVPLSNDLSKDRQFNETHETHEVSRGGSEDLLDEAAPIAPKQSPQQHRVETLSLLEIASPQVKMDRWDGLRPEGGKSKGKSGASSPAITEGSPLQPLGLSGMGHLLHESRPQSQTIELKSNVTQGAAGSQRLDTDSINTLGMNIRKVGDLGGGEVRIRLKPEHLGSLQIRVTSEGNSIGLQIRASDSNAKQILEESLSSLKDSLKAHHLELTSSQIAVGDGSLNSSGSANHSAMNFDQSEGQFTDQRSMGFAGDSSERNGFNGDSSWREFAGQGSAFQGQSQRGKPRYADEESVGGFAKVKIGAFRPAPNSNRAGRLDVRV